MKNKQGRAVADDNETLSDRDGECRELILEMVDRQIDQHIDTFLDRAYANYHPRAQSKQCLRQQRHGVSTISDKTHEAPAEPLLGYHYATQVGPRTQRALYESF